MKFVDQVVKDLKLEHVDIELSIVQPRRRWCSKERSEFLHFGFKNVWDRRGVLMKAQDGQAEKRRWGAGNCIADGAEQEWEVLSGVLQNGGCCFEVDRSVRDKNEK